MARTSFGKTGIFPGRDRRHSATGRDSFIDSSGDEGQYKLHNANSDDEDGGEDEADDEDDLLPLALQEVAGRGLGPYQLRSRRMLCLRDPFEKARTIGPSPPAQTRISSAVLNTLHRMQQVLVDGAQTDDVTQLLSKLWLRSGKNVAGLSDEILTQYLVSLSDRAGGGLKCGPGVISQKMEQDAAAMYQRMVEDLLSQSDRYVMLVANHEALRDAMRRNLQLLSTQQFVEAREVPPPPAPTHKPDSPSSGPPPPGLEKSSPSTRRPWRTMDMTADIRYLETVTGVGMAGRAASPELESQGKAEERTHGLLSAVGEPARSKVDATFPISFDFIIPEESPPDLQGRAEPVVTRPRRRSSGSAAKRPAVVESLKPTQPPARSSEPREVAAGAKRTASVKGAKQPARGLQSNEPGKQILGLIGAVGPASNERRPSNAKGAKPTGKSPAKPKGKWKGKAGAAPKGAPKTTH